ncbi:MAG: bacillithiol system redox-active protein YtxJ [Chitinophagaceae bacterium]|nr:bacillithiol system redox-active protein YtxJ [Chitinophagaceae bacterium]
MDWITLDDISQLKYIREKSFDKPQVIFKHSTRCGISRMVLSRLERSDQPETADFYFLDLLKYRPISNAVADEFHVVHESPQVIIIKEGKQVYNASHSAVRMETIAEEIGK